MHTPASNFSVDEIGQLITIANLLGVQISEKEQSTIDLYLNAIIRQLNHIPYVAFPTAFHCVDIAILRYMEEGGDDYSKELLLGRKSGKTKYQFIGGFVNPGETSHQAAKRETLEESKIIIEETRLNYIGSFFIDDERFKSGPHKLTTSFFYTIVPRSMMAGADDDIEETKWFRLSDLQNEPHEIIIDPHLSLLNSLMKYLS